MDPIPSPISQKLRVRPTKHRIETSNIIFTSKFERTLLPNQKKKQKNHQDSPNASTVYLFCVFTTFFLHPTYPTIFGPTSLHHRSTFPARHLNFLPHWRWRHRHFVWCWGQVQGFPRASQGQRQDLEGLRSLPMTHPGEWQIYLT